MRTFIRRRTSQAGFTLAEILIALALIAVLAAVLLPSVASQISKGDAGRTMQDVDAIRTGVEQFLADVHRYPKTYVQLSKPITGSDQDINGVTIASGLITKWGGPYVTKEMLNIATGLQTGFGGRIQNTFIIDSQSTAGLPRYLSVEVLDVDSLAWRKLEEALDGPAADSSTGVVQWAGGATPKVRLLIVPIQ